MSQDASSAELVDDLAAFGRERLGLGARAIPDRHVVAGLEQALRHGRSHAAGADPADLLRILRHRETLRLTIGGAALAVLARLRQRRAVIRPCRRLSPASLWRSGRPHYPAAARREQRSGGKARQRGQSPEDSAALCRTPSPSPFRRRRRAAPASGCAPSRATPFRFWWWARCGRSSPAPACFRASCFRRWSDVAAAFVDLTRAGILPHARGRDAAAAAVGLRARRRGRRDHRRADGALAPRRGHPAAAGQHPGADPRPRLRAAVPALVRAGRSLRRAAGRLRVDVRRSSSTAGPA